MNQINKNELIKVCDFLSEYWDSLEAASIITNLLNAMEVLVEITKHKGLQKRIYEHYKFSGEEINNE